MLVGIDASRAFLKNRTGIEEYSYQVIKNLSDKLNGHQVVLYIRSSQHSRVNSSQMPKNWKIKIINWPYLWTQIGLSLEMLLHPVDVLFIPAHTVPLIHPKNTVVTIHGLEYEFCPEAYSFWERLYMRCSIKNSCRWASKIIAVSNNTKQDLIKLYGVDEKKIQVVYEGYAQSTVLLQAYPRDISHQSSKNTNVACHSERVPPRRDESKNLSSRSLGEVYTRETGARDDIKKYLLFIGRLEERKNIINIIKAFELLKEKYNIPHKLILAGKPGYGYEQIKKHMSGSSYKSDIIETGFVSEAEKWELLKKADVFVFPTLYEGFGIPILEAQSVGCPVVASNNSSVPEVTGETKPLLPPGEGARRADEGVSAILVDPLNIKQIASAIHNLISDETLKNAIIQKGYENVKRFSWEQCSAEIAKLLHG